MSEILQHCIKINASFHFWFGERVQSVFQAIKVNEAEVCIYLTVVSTKLLHIYMYCCIHKHIVQLDEKSKRKTLATANGRCCRYCFYFAAASTVTVFFFSLLFVANVYFSRFTVLFRWYFDISWLNRYRIVPSEMLTCLPHAACKMYNY